jgi:hypothetical protein
MTNLAIIGAGIAGLTLASCLKDTTQLTILEKSRGTGGRLATRRAGEFQFDHGAQYFTARSQEFRQFLNRQFDSTTLQDWQPRTLTLSAGEKSYRRPWFEPHWVGAPAMNTLGKVLSSQLDIELQATVKSLTSTSAGWILELENGQERGPFDWVAITAPAAQTRALLPTEFQHHQALQKVRMSSCFSLMLGFRQPPQLPFQAARSKDSPLGWIAVDSEKPGRDGPFSLLVQSSNSWADLNLEKPLEQIQDTLLSAVLNLLPNLPEPDHLDLHRWRYAATVEPLGQDFLIDPALKLAACGDWCLGGRVEAAFTSAYRLANALRDSL